MFLWIQGQNQWLIKSRVDYSIVAMDMDLSMVVWGDGTVCEPKDVESQDSSSSSAVSTAKKSSRKAKSSKGRKVGEEDNQDSEVTFPKRPYLHFRDDVGKLLNMEENTCTMPYLNFRKHLKSVEHQRNV